MNSLNAFAISVLPVPVGPTKRKTPSGRVGSVRPAFTSAIVDEALDRLRLPEDASVEGRADPLEAQRRPWVEDVERQPGCLAERRDHGLRVDRARDAARDSVADELEHP